MWDIIDLDLALQRLEKAAPRQARALELRYFGGLQNEEVARALDVSVSTARADIRLASAWLHRELSSD